MDAATLAAAKAYANKRLNWRGAWTATTAYAKNDLVTYNGGLYRAPNAFTSGASFVIANWVELVQQFGTSASSSSTPINVRDSTYGAKGDGRKVTNGAIAAGQAILTSVSATFLPGQTVCVLGAGVSGAPLVATILSVSSGTATLSVTASTTVAGATVYYGTDDTAAIQAAIDAAKIAKRSVILPAPIGTFYLITAALNVSRRGQRFGGDSPWYTQIVQVTFAANGINILDDADADTPQGTSSAHHVIFSNLRIIGLGSTISTGDGIHAPSDGDWFRMDNVTVYGWLRAAYFNGWSQVTLANCVLHYSGVGLALDSADSYTNTIELLTTAIVRCDTAGLSIMSGLGCTIVGGDWGFCPQMIQMIDTFIGQLTIVGGNMESSTGTEFVYVGSNQRFTSIGTAYQKVAGNEANAVRVNGGGVLMQSPVFGGMLSTTALVKKTTNTDVVEVIDTTASLSAPMLSVSDPGTSYNFARFHQRAENALPAPSATTRGLILQTMSRDSSTADDALYWYMRQNGGASPNYQRRRLDNIIEGAGAPEGVVSAKIGTVYVRTDGGATPATTLYVKESGTGNTGWVGHGATGPAGPAGSRRDVVVSARGLLSENFDLSAVQAGTAPTAGTAYGFPIGLFSGDVVTYLCVPVLVAGAGTAPTLIRLGLADSSGTIIAVTADEHANTAWTTANAIAKISLSSPYTAAITGGYTVVFLQVGTWGTTQMTLGRNAIMAANGLSGRIGSGLPVSATYGTGRTDLPAVASALPSPGANTLTYWAAAA